MGDLGPSTAWCRVLTAQHGKERASLYYSAVKQAAPACSCTWCTPNAGRHSSQRRRAWSAFGRFAVVEVVWVGGRLLRARRPHDGLDVLVLCRQAAGALFASRSAAAATSITATACPGCVTLGPEPMLPTCMVWGVAPPVGHHGVALGPQLQGREGPCRMDGSAHDTCCAA